MRKLTLLFAFLLSFNMIGFSQNEANPWSIGIHVGAQQYNGELQNQFFDFSNHQYGLAGFSVGRYLSSHIDLNFDVNIGQIQFQNEEIDTYRRYKYNMQQGNLHLNYNFLKEDVKFRPFVFAGIGMIRFKGEGRTESNLSLPSAGLGLVYKLSEHVKVRYQNTLLLSNYDELDNSIGGGNDSYLQTTIGIYATILGTQDEDNDGVTDKKDKCPGTAPGTKVNKEGCAIDRDSDGVNNDEDKCPDVAGKVEFAGCPDSDNDGVIDSEDKCPNVAGTKEMGGCADSDNDGVADNLDKCPNEAGTLERGGCPEPIDVKSMGKYVFNKLPLENGTLVIYDENGVAVDTVMTNAEGIFEYTTLDPDKNYTIRPMNFDGDDSKIDIFLVDDKGEKTRGTRKLDDGTFVFSNEETKKTDPVVDSKPVVDTKKPVVDTKKSDPVVDTKPQDISIPAELLGNIEFSTSSSTINIKYYSKLDRLAAVLKKSNKLKITINGHADSTGSLEFNNRLSKARADRVKAYLVRKGVNTNQIDTKGFGITKPIASNETTEGKSRNRRVEFKLKK